jgi:hypothetical protein
MVHHLLHKGSGHAETKKGQIQLFNSWGHSWIFLLLPQDQYVFKLMCPKMKSLIFPAFLDR